MNTKTNKLFIMSYETYANLTRAQFSSVTQSCPTLLQPQGLQHTRTLSITNSWSLLKLMSIELVMPSNHLILCRPLLLLPSNLSQRQGLFQ